MAISADDIDTGRVLPRSLAGATVLQIVPTLRNEASAWATVGVARALVQAGARAIVAGENGPLVNELKSFGGEWLPFSGATAHIGRLRSNAAALEAFVAAERVDVVHAKNAGAAWSAQVATEKNRIWLVTELPNLPRGRMLFARYYLGALARGDRLIARSLYSAEPMMKRYNIPAERISIIPIPIDTEAFDPTTVQPARMAALRQAWGIPSGVRIILVPSRVAPEHGQIGLVDAIRSVVDSGVRNFTVVFAGDDHKNRGYVRKMMKKAQEQGVAPLFRLVGRCLDMPAAYAAADVVVVPYVSAPVHGQVVAEAQAMARPVVTTAVGALPEHLLVPPRMADELRTGWVVPPKNPGELALALAEALALDDEAFDALAARAREFAEFVFAPDRAAGATLGVYSALLAGER